MSRSFAILIGVVFAVAACGGTTPPPVASSGASTPAATAAPTPTPTPTPSPTESPEPTPTPVTEYQAPEDLVVGDCYDPIEDEESEVLLAAAIRACDDPHLHEVFGLVDLPDPAGAPFPIERDIEDASIELCDPAFETYVGVSIDDSSYSYLYYTPTEGTWADGDRVVMCVVDDRGDFISGTVKGTGN